METFLQKLVSKYCDKILFLSWHASLCDREPDEKEVVLSLTPVYVTDNLT